MVLVRGGTNDVTAEARQEAKVGTLDCKPREQKHPSVKTRERMMGQEGRGMGAGTSKLARRAHLMALTQLVG